MITIINYSLPVDDRISMRQNLIKTFLSENPGNGIGDNASRYQYNVEQYLDYGIYLKRPTQLNKGFDFTVNIQGLFFKKYRKYSNPSHQDIINALIESKTNFPILYPIIANQLQQIYNCIPVILTTSGVAFTDYNDISHPIEIILLAIKWLFMEQDCAYWNYSGRSMFYELLSSHCLV